MELKKNYVTCGFFLFLTVLYSHVHGYQKMPPFPSKRFLYEQSQSSKATTVVLILKNPLSHCKVAAVLSSLAPHMSHPWINEESTFCCWRHLANLKSYTI